MLTTVESSFAKHNVCQAPVLGQGLGDDFTFASDNNKINNN